TTSSTSPRSHASRTGAAIARPRGSRATTRWTESPTSSTASSGPPRAFDPSGLFLIDKPEGPSSFAVVADVRRRTGARTGHAGTLDPFAPGLLLVLVGRTTNRASCFVGLDKRYLTDVDLRAATDTGDREGSLLEERDPRDAHGRGGRSGGL